jgi:hypothetical protein
MPDVQAATDGFERRNKNDLALLRQDTLPAIGRSILNLRKAIHAIRGQTRITWDAQASDIQDARRKALSELDDTDRYAKQAIANIRDDIAKQTETKLDPQAALLDALQRQMAARRLDNLQAAGVDPSVIITRASAAADTTLLAVLREELPLFAGDGRANQVHLEALLDQLDSAELPLSSATKQAARILSDELKFGQMNLSNAFGLARMEATGSSGPGFTGTVSTVMGWAKGSIYRIAFTDETGGETAPPTPTATGTTGSPGPDIAAQIAANAAARAAAVSASEAAMRAGRPNRDGQ